MPLASAFSAQISARLRLSLVLGGSLLISALAAQPAQAGFTLVGAPAQPAAASAPPANSMPMAATSAGPNASNVGVISLAPAQPQSTPAAEAAMATAPMPAPVEASGEAMPLTSAASSPNVLGTLPATADTTPTDMTPTESVVMTPPPAMSEPPMTPAMMTPAPTDIVHLTPPANMSGMSTPANASDTFLAVPPTLMASADTAPTGTMAAADTDISLSAAPAQSISSGPPSSPSATAETTVIGFGKNVPLSVAMQQVLPDGYSFSLAADVNPATSVTWSGGRPWPEVLDAMLAGAGLSSQVQDHNIAISHNASGLGSLPVAPAAMAAPEATPLAPPGVAASSSGSVDMNAGAHMLTPPGVADATAGMAPADSSSMAGSDQPMEAMSWDAETGQSLHQVLSEWCRRIHTDLQWQTEYDFPIQGSLHLTGSFQSAVQQLLRGFENADPQPVGILHKNTGVGQPILLIQTRGNSYGE